MERFSLFKVFCFTITSKQKYFLKTNAANLQRNFPPFFYFISFIQSCADNMSCREISETGNTGTVVFQFFRSLFWYKVSKRHLKTTLLLLPQILGTTSYLNTTVTLYPPFVFPLTHQPEVPGLNHHRPGVFSSVSHHKVTKSQGGSFVPRSSPLLAK